MSRDYKPSPKTKAKKSSGGSPFLSGFLLGILIGVCVTVALTIFLKNNNPFAAEPNNASVAGQNSNSVSEIAITPNSEEGQKLQDPNKFDFYTVLPEENQTVTEQKVDENEVIKQETYFLQLGAFESEGEADNMRAKLALQGFESIIQKAEIKDKGTWHRVRIGPFANIEQINQIRADLVLNGFKPDLIKVRTETNAN